MNAEEPVEVLAIGSPFLDHIIPVSEDYLASLPGGKGGMEEVDFSTFKRIIATAGPRTNLASGGSGANTIKGLSYLGHKCALAGKIGNDDAGITFIESIEKSGVISYLMPSGIHTGQIACLITPDGERTFRDYFGAGEKLHPDELKDEFFEGVKLVHIEGYTLLNERLVVRAMELAKKHGAKISFDLASFELAAQFRPQIVHLLSHHVAILFANTLETRALTGLDPERGCSILSDLCDIAVVLMGKDGCWVGGEDGLVRCPAYPVDPLDTTGAGDLFAAGFLHGYLSGKSYAESAHYGALVAAEVVQVYGAEIPETVWAELRTKVSTTS